VIGARHGGRIGVRADVPGMVAAAACILIAIASSAPRRLIKGMLKATGLRSHVSAFIYGEEAPHGRPSPDIYPDAAWP
jgi:beta-phosphoglucomutase-like phosphatase (HAD superfamily)